MAVEAQLHKETLGVLDYTPLTAAKTAGEMIQRADGRAAAVATGLSAAEKGASYTGNVFKVAKTADVVLLEGQQVYWVKSTSKMSYTGDFAIGVMVADAAAADTHGYVELNVEPKPVISLKDGQWTWAATEGEGVVATDNILKLAFDAVAEVAMAALYSDATIALDQGPIMEAWLAIYDIGDAAALDINAGLANETHATDFDAVAEFAGIHFDGTALSINVESDDGTTEVAADDSTVDAVDDTYGFLQVDARNLADVKVYWNGVDLGALAEVTMKLDAATGPVFPIVHMEKTSDDTTAEVRVKSMHVRTATTV